MKFKKNWKRFWTLNRHHAEGFTLVELIVVIAIIAILAGAGTVGYSAYVKKANIAADQALVSQVEQAVILYNYSENFAANAGNGTVGYVILTQDEDAVAEPAVSGTYMSDAMEAAFGANWRETLRLSYNGWTDTATMLNQVANNKYAASVNGSSYITNVGTEALLGDVQGCASAFAEFLVTSDENGKWSGKAGAEALANLVGGAGKTTIDSMLDGYNDEDIDSAVLANATVFGIAAAIDDTAAQAIISGFSGDGEFTDGYIYKAATGGLSGELNMVAHTYAALEALVGYLNLDETNSVLSKLNQQGLLGNKNDILGNITDACEEVVTIAIEKAQDRYLAYYDGENSLAKKDGEAYVAVMQTVNGLNTGYTDSLGEKELFDSTAMADRVNSYIAAASIKSLLGDSVIGHDMLNKIANGNYGSSVVLIFSVDETGALGCDDCPTNVLP